MTQQTTIFSYVKFPEVKQATLRGRVLECLKNSYEPMTNNELSETLRIKINVITPRVYELREMNFLTEAGRRPDHFTGVESMTWKLSPVYNQYKAEA